MITLADEIKELERELINRQRIYPDWTKGPNPKLRPDVANHRIACIESTLKRLREQQAKTGTQANLF